MRLYHFTCDHARRRLGDGGMLLPAWDQVPPGARRDALPPSASFVWLTDLDVPIPGVLGLTSDLLDCDRTAHRYRVVASSGPVVPWTAARKRLDPVFLDQLEQPPAMLRHWFVSTLPVRVVLDDRPGS